MGAGKPKNWRLLAVFVFLALVFPLLALSALTGFPLLVLVVPGIASGLSYALCCPDSSGVSVTEGAKLGLWMALSFSFIWIVGLFVLTTIVASAYMGSSFQAAAKEIVFMVIYGDDYGSYSPLYLAAAALFSFVPLYLEIWIGLALAHHLLTQKTSA